MRLTVLVNELAGVKADQTTWLLVCAMLDRGDEVAVGGVADLELSPDDRVRLRAARLTAPAPSPAEALATLLASPPTSVDLFEEAGVLVRRRDGRRNVYEIELERPLRHPVEQHRTIGDLLRMVSSAASAP